MKKEMRIGIAVLMLMAVVSLAVVSAVTFSCSPITNTCTINLNEQVTTTFSGGNYSIKLIFVDATYAQFQVVDSKGNFQTTTKISKGGGYKLADGTQLGVIDINYQAYYRGTMYAVISLGSPGQPTSPSCGGSSNVSESMKFEKSSDRLNMNDALSDIWTTKITGVNLPTLLKDGTFRSKDNIDYEYEQYLSFTEPINFTHFDDDDYKADTPSLGIRVRSATSIINYTLDFKKYPRSDIVGGRLEDLEDRDIVILGKTYRLINAYNFPTKFVLMRGAVTDILNLNAATTKTIGAKTYTITLIFVDATYAQFKVVDSAGNSQTTTKLAKGGTYKLIDGTQLGVVDISYQAFSGGTISAEFILGANRLVIEDGKSLKIDDTTENSINCWIHKYNVPDTNKVDIAKLGFEWKTDDELFIAKDSSPLLPGLNSFEFVYGGFVTPCEETTKVRAIGTYGIELVVPIKDGEATIPILYGDANNFTSIGGGIGEHLLRTGGNTLTFDKDTDDYFVASWSDGTNVESYLLTISSVTEDSSIGKNYTTIKNVVTGVEYKDKKADDIITMGKVELTIKQIHKENKEVTLSINPYDSKGTFNKVYTKGGLWIELPKPTDVPTSNYILKMSEEDKDGNIGRGALIQVTLGHASSEAEPIEIEPSTGWSAGAYKEIGSSYVYEGYVHSDLGTKVLFSKPTSGQNDAQIIYHCQQSFGQIILNSCVSEPIVPPPQQNCIDSDALNYYLKGNVKGIATCEDTFRVDECYSSKTKLTGGSGDYVFEAICGGNCPAGQLVYCSYGCRSGACLKSTMGLASTRPGIIGWFKNLFS